MALTLKTDVEDIPSILKLIGIGGMPAAASDTGGASPEPPPIDPAIAGAPDPATAPDATPSAASVIPSTHDAAQPPTKLLRLQQALGAAAPAQPAPPIDPAIAGSPEDSPTQPSTPAAGPVVPRGTLGLAAQPAPNLTEPKGTFATNHPTLAKVLGLGLGFVQDAGPGVGSRTFGEGFQTAAAQPALREQRGIETQTAKANLAHTQATTEQMKSQVTLPNGLTVPFALAQKLYPTLLTEQGKDTRSQAGIDSKEAIANQKNVMALRAKGLKPNPADPNGAPVALSRDEMSESEQATLDLKQSQQDAAAAKAELDRQKNNPNSPAYKAAAGRLAVAQKNADTAAGRLGIEAKKYQADYFGTDDKGNALPGAPTDDAGNPIGPRVANAGAASADRLKRGDLARNATQNANSIQRIVGSRPDLFGAISGRITNVQQMLGSDDPDIARLGVEVHNLALASNGAHGVRSAGAVEQTENELINHFKMGPNAVNAALDSMKDSLGTFTEDQKHGKRPVPSNAGTPKAQVQATPPPGATNEVYAADGKTLIGHTVGNKYVPLPKK